MKGAGRPTILLVGLALLSGACATASVAGDGNGNTYAPDDLVLRIDVSGGFLAPGAAITHLPMFSLYGDGRVIRQGPQIEIYPQPALPSVTVATLTDDGFRRIVQAAIAAGLNGPDRHYVTPTVADAGTTTFTLLLDGRRHTISVNGLIDGSEPGVPSAERAVRVRLVDLRSKLTGLEQWLRSGSLGQEHQFDPSRMAIMVGTQSPDPTAGLPQKDVRWPIGQSPAALAKPVGGAGGPQCLTLSGHELGLVLPLARTANGLTPWVAGSDRFWLSFRPLLPDEIDCSALRG